MPLSESKDAIDRLEEASQKHETNIVIDLGMDRLIKWIGVYLLLALAVVAKIADYVGPYLSCYPPNRSAKVSPQFITFSVNYCWESPQTNGFNNSCISDKSLLRNPDGIKSLMQWLPYAMLLQTILFSLPSAIWHFRVGARLIGHLKFMQLLLHDIFLKLHVIKTGNYAGPYDKDCACFNGRSVYPKDKRKEKSFNSDVAPTVGRKSSDGVKNDKAKKAGHAWFNCRKTDDEDVVEVVTEEPTGERDKLVSNEHKGNVMQISSQRGDESEGGGEKTSRLCGLIIGDMKDKHFFSMLCYENFASLHHIPYILSMFELCPKVTKRGHGYHEIYESMLLQWCDKDNMSKTFLIKAYFFMQWMIAISSAIMLILLSWSVRAISGDFSSSETFSCLLPYDDLCVLCTILRKQDVIAIFALDFIMTIAMLALSLVNWFLVRKSVILETCHFFDQMNEKCSAALSAAALYDVPKNKDKVAKPPKQDKSSSTEEVCLKESKV